MRAALALTLALGCGGEPEPSTGPDPEPTVGAAEPAPAEEAPAEEAPVEPAAPSSAHAVYLETADAAAAAQLLARYDAAGDPAHGYPPSGSSGDPAYPRIVGPGEVEGLNAHAVLVALPEEAPFTEVEAPLDTSECMEHG